MSCKYIPYSRKFLQGKIFVNGLFLKFVDNIFADPKIQDAIFLGDGRKVAFESIV